MSSRNIRNKRAGLDVPKYSAQRLAGTSSLHDPGPNVHHDPQYVYAPFSVTRPLAQPFAKVIFMLSPASIWSLLRNIPPSES